MKNFFFVTLWSAILLLTTASCILEEPGFNAEVIRIENSSRLLSEDDNEWKCREALIDRDGYAWHVCFPIQYEYEIESGTVIEYQCQKMVSYYKNGKRIPIDWDGTKEN